MSWNTEQSLSRRNAQYFINGLVKYCQVTLGKGAYLKKITSHIPMRSVEVGKHLEGSSPPSVFVGSWNYPKVYAGPMIAPLHGDTGILDTPESWIPAQRTQEEIIRFRLSLVRGKKQVDAGGLDDRFIGKLQEIAMADSSIESQAEFMHEPRGASLSDEHTPYGPSGEITRFDIDNVRWNQHLERAYHDTDLKAKNAVLDLYRQGLPFSSIQKALSVGTLGVEDSRKLVPTRWSITACDSMIGDNLLDQVRKNQVIDCIQVREFSSLNNRYAVILLPTPWQYEWTEAFLRILGNEEMVFSDHEGHRGKKGYSSVGGCYYSCKMAVLESLAREQRQAGAIILREARTGYVPLGVFNVRENVRHAMLSPPKEFEDLKSALESTTQDFVLPTARFVQESPLLRSLLREKQTSLSEFS